MKRRTWGFIIGGLAVALLLAAVVSNLASPHPDGLDSALRQGCAFDAEDNIIGGDCPARQAREHELGDSPLADYGIRGLDNPYLSTGLSGTLGVLLTFAVGAGVFWLLRRRGGSPPNGGTDGEATASGTSAKAGNGGAG